MTPKRFAGQGPTAEAIIRALPRLQGVPQSEVQLLLEALDALKHADVDEAWADRMLPPRADELLNAQTPPGAFWY